MLRQSMTLLVSTVKHMRHGNQLLLIPLTIWSGLEQSFLSAQFTKVQRESHYDMFVMCLTMLQGFVSCTLNAKYVGLVLIAYGICDSIGSVSFGQIAKLVGRWPCFLLAAIINYSLIVTMFVWKPTENQIVVLFVLAGLWGVADAVWQTQINAFYGVIFVDKDEAAFSNYRLWESSGFVLFYIITPYIRIRLALIILVIFLTMGMLGYGLTEYRLRKKSIKKNQVAPS
jgi:MFS family permease